MKLIQIRMGKYQPKKKDLVEIYKSRGTFINKKNWFVLFFFVLFFFFFFFGIENLHQRMSDCK